MKEDLQGFLPAEGRTVRALKRHLRTSCGASRFQQRLLRDGVIMQDDDALDTHGDLQLLVVAFAVSTEEQVEQLIAAAASDRAHEVEAILQRPQAPNLRNARGWTALLVAADRGGERCARLLMEASADLHQTTTRGETALHLASAQGSADIARLLLEAGCAIDAADLHGATALHAACSHGHAAVVRLLLEARGDAEQVRGAGTKLLRTACRGGYSAVVRLLLEAGANKNESCLSSGCRLGL